MSKRIETAKGLARLAAKLLKGNTVPDFAHRFTEKLLNSIEMAAAKTMISDMTSRLHIDLPQQERKKIISTLSKSIRSKEFVDELATIVRSMPDTTKAIVY